jgi:hypothetical protein
MEIRAKLPLAVALDTEVSREEIEVVGQQLGEREKRAERAEAHMFWKMVYGNFFRKPFSQIY